MNLIATVHVVVCWLDKSKSEYLACLAYTMKYVIMQSKFNNQLLY